MWSPASNTVGFTTSGVNRVSISTSLLSTTIPIDFTVAALGTPSGTNGRIGVDNSSGRPPFLQKASAEFGNVHVGAAPHDRYYAWILPSGSGTANTLGISIGTAGTISYPGPSSTNFRTSSNRVLITTATTAGSSAEVYSSNQAFAWRGNAAGLGGFLFHARWAPNNTVTANQRGFVGFCATATALGNADPSSLLNLIGVGYNSADTNLQIMNNDGSGTATKLDTGISARSATVVVDIWIYAAPNGGNVQVYVTRVDGTAGTKSTTLSTDLPSTTTFLAVHCWTNNGTTAAAAACDLMRLVLENPQ
jgi:hypothetical protein